MSNKRFMSLLSKEYPDEKAAAMEIVNLSATLSLPKGTEYFFSDLHGEHEAFIHMLKSASGVIREKIDWIFGNESPASREELAQLVYSPEKILEQKSHESNFDNWCRKVIVQLIAVCKESANKYTRAMVRKRLPESYAYIMDELLHETDEANKAHYYEAIINSLVSTGMAPDFIQALSETISKLAVDKLHIVGDVFDRGAHPDYIMEYLINYDNVDFEWGNHDINWMGASLGNWACIANLLRVNIGYNNFDMMEIGYGINLRPLSAFASQTYGDDDCKCFAPKVFDKNKFDPVDMSLAAKMNKAISIIQFKAEAQLTALHPEYHTSHRVFLDKINFKNGTVNIEGKDYPMRDCNFPTVDPDNPFSFSDDEKDVMERLSASFKSSKQLHKHIQFLLSHGSLYRIFNGNLLYHGCMPMTEDGEFAEIDVGGGKTLKGKAYFDYIDCQVRDLFKKPSNDIYAGHLLWYLWSGGKSPLFGKSTITTFQRFFVEDKATHKEPTDPYYKLIADREICLKILKEFGLGENSHIINGHVPVKTKLGENPIKGGGLLFVIDGGMAKSYHSTTGIAGYTLIFNSRYLALAQHQQGETDIGSTPTLQTVEYLPKRLTLADTDDATEILEQIDELKLLIDYYREQN